MTIATHILPDSPFDKGGHFPAKKIKPTRYCLIGFAFSRFWDHYRNSFEVLLEKMYIFMLSCMDQNHVKYDFVSLFSNTFSIPLFPYALAFPLSSLNFLLSFTTLNFTARVTLCAPHILKRRSLWFQAKCVHSNISIN